MVLRHKKTVSGDSVPSGQKDRNDALALSLVACHRSPRIGLILPPMKAVNISKLRFEWPLDDRAHSYVVRRLFL